MEKETTPQPENRSFRSRLEERKRKHEWFRKMIKDLWEREIEDPEARVARLFQVFALEMVPYAQGAMTKTEMLNRESDLLIRALCSAQGIKPPPGGKMMIFLTVKWEEDGMVWLVSEHSW